MGKLKMEGDDKTATGTYRILIAESIELVRKALITIVNEEADMIVCGQALYGEGILDSIDRQRPNIVILDMELPGTDSLKLIARIKNQASETAVMALSTQNKAICRSNAIQAGAKGYLLKTEPIDTIVKAIRHIAAGKTWVSEQISSDIVSSYFTELAEPQNIKQKLTRREIQIFEMIGNGFSTKEIGAKLFISQRTVESHRDHIKNKLELKDSFHLHQFAFNWVHNSALVKN
jgi:DNA-binding NarL/FixJ family response regulator